MHDHSHHSPFLYPIWVTNCIEASYKLNAEALVLWLIAMYGYNSSPRINKIPIWCWASRATWRKVSYWKKTFLDQEWQCGMNRMLRCTSNNSQSRHNECEMWDLRMLRNPTYKSTKNKLLIQCSTSATDNQNYRGTPTMIQGWWWQVGGGFIILHTDWDPNSHDINTRAADLTMKIMANMGTWNPGFPWISGRVPSESLI